MVGILLVVDGFEGYWYCIMEVIDMVYKKGVFSLCNGCDFVV